MKEKMNKLFKKVYKLIIKEEIYKLLKKIYKLIEEEKIYKLFKEIYNLIEKKICKIKEAKMIIKRVRLKIKRSDL